MNRERVDSDLEGACERLRQVPLADETPGRSPEVKPDAATKPKPAKPRPTKPAKPPKNWHHNRTCHSEGREQRATKNLRYAHQPVCCNVPEILRSRSLP
jgi:hypothetical protein